MNKNIDQDLFDTISIKKVLLKGHQQFNNWKKNIICLFIFWYFAFHKANENKLILLCEFPIRFGICIWVNDVIRRALLAFFNTKIVHFHVLLHVKSSGLPSVSNYLNRLCTHGGLLIEVKIQWTYERIGKFMRFHQELEKMISLTRNSINVLDVQS